MMDAEAVRPDVFGLSHVGKVRSENEDHFLVASLRKTLTLKYTNVEQAHLLERDSGPEALLLLVADGVGGNEAGADASRTAATSIVEYLSTAASCFNNLDIDREHEFMEKLEDSVHLAHSRITATTSGQRRSATTLTMALLVWPRAYVVHVGDTRAMFLRRGRLRVLTRDQTVAEELVDAGALTEEQASRSRFTDQLLSAVGGSNMTPVLGIIDFRPGDVFLLCSDGLTKHVNDTYIAEVLGKPSNAEAMSRELVDAALAGGGTDNVSVIVARMTIGGALTN